MKLWLWGVTLLTVASGYVSLPLGRPGPPDLLALPGHLSVSEVTAQLANAANTAYTASVSIGTPPQNFTLLLDTGSGYLWVPSPVCPDCAGERTFNDTASSTYFSDGAVINITYVDGFCSGNSSTDTVSISDASVSEQPFVLTTDAYFYEGLNADGILGMGFSALSSDMSTLMDSLVDQGVIDQKVFSVFLTGESDTRSSELVLGGFNTSRYAHDNPVYYFPLIGSDLGQWTVELFTVRFNAEKMAVTQTVALVDTGVGLITVPLSDFLTLVGWFQEYARCDTDGRFLWCDCSPKLTNSGFPEFGFDFGTASLYLSSSNYLLPFTVSGRTYCQVLVQARDTNLWVIGAVFLRQFYSVYDMNGMRVGFASAAPKLEPDTVRVWVTAVVIIVAVCCIGFAVLFCVCLARWKAAHRDNDRDGS